MLANFHFTFSHLSLRLTLHHGHAHEMARAPIALHEPPSARNVDRIPGVPESVTFKPDTWLVSGRLAESLDDNAVKSGVAAQVEREDGSVINQLGVIWRLAGAAI